MHIHTISQPLVEPVTLAEAKTLLRVDTADEDSLLTALIATARTTIEHMTGHALIVRDLELSMDSWPSGRHLCIPMSPLQGVSSVVLVDAQGAETIWPDSSYFVEAAGPRPRLVLRSGRVWPGVSRPVGGIRVRFSAGYGADPAAVPPPLGHAVLLLVAHWFENRIPVVMSAPSSQVPATVGALISAYRTPRI